MESVSVGQYGVELFIGGNYSYYVTGENQEPSLVTRIGKIEFSRFKDTIRGFVESCAGRPMEIRGTRYPATRVLYTLFHPGISESLCPKNVYSQIKQVKDYGRVKEFLQLFGPVLKQVTDPRNFSITGTNFEFKDCNIEGLLHDAMNEAESSVPEKTVWIRRDSR